MRAIVRTHFEIELSQAKTSIAAEEYKTAWIALQRAHILAQNYPFAHALIHWHMLLLSWKQRDIKELMGQILPTLLAIPLTLLFGRRRSLRMGRVNVNDFERSIPEDLRDILNQ